MFRVSVIWEPEVFGVELRLNYWNPIEQGGNCMVRSKYGQEQIVDPSGQSLLVG